MPISSRSFGAKGTLWSLRNDGGATLSVTDRGAAIVDLVVPDCDGRPVDVNLGHASPDAYVRNRFAYGAVVGRYANRIRGAHVELNGVGYALEADDGKNTLHGGPDRYYHRRWDTVEFDEESVTLGLTSPDGDQGMPGEVQITVTYALTADNAVALRYRAVSSADTYLNLSNHAYLNLAGHDSGPIDEHVLWLDCDAFTVIDAEFLPTGELRDVSGTPFDFRRAKSIGRDMGSDDEQLVAGNGYDHTFVLNSPGLDRPFARVTSPTTGIVMEVATDLPGVQLYAGNNLGHGDHEKGAEPYVRRGGLCLETQFFPDSPHHENFPSTALRAGEVFASTTIYRFGVIASA